MCHQALVARRPDAGAADRVLSLDVAGRRGRRRVQRLPRPGDLRQRLGISAGPGAGLPGRGPGATGRSTASTWAMLIAGRGRRRRRARSSTPSSRRTSTPSRSSAASPRWTLFELAVQRAASAPRRSAAFLVRSRGLLFFAVIAVLSIGAPTPRPTAPTRTQSWRSFFGVLRQSATEVPALGGPVRMLSHGTTLHGAQARRPALALQSAGLLRDHARRSGRCSWPSSAQKPAAADRRRGPRHRLGRRPTCARATA